MIITDPAQINLKSIDRFIAVGCSFTQYRWPTWADILHKETDGAEYFNAGRSGAGNQYIFTQINQYINKLELTENDLIAIMWTGFYREDRYVQGRHQNWITPGNLFTQNQYTEEFMAKMCCPRGLTVRDMALIDATVRMLDPLPCKVIMMPGIPFELQSEYSGVDYEIDVTDVLELYNHLKNYMLPDLFTTEFPRGWLMEYKYTDAEGELFTDYHPSIFKYGCYLEKIGFNISADTQNWIDSTHKSLLAVTHKDQLIEPDASVIL